MKANDVTVVVAAEVDSTNLWAEREGIAGARDGTLFVAERQTGGKGRLGRAWQSDGKGLYMTLLLRPDVEARSLTRLPLLVAVAVSEALREFGAEVLIKWPNDVVGGGRKLCGILCESRLAGRRVEFCVIGAGINLGQEEDDFGPELREKAASVKMLTGIAPAREAMIDAFLRAMERWTDAALAGDPAFLRAYGALSATLGREVLVIEGERQWRGVAREIGEDGALLVEGADGPRMVHAGDVSVRGVMGYV